MQNENHAPRFAASLTHNLSRARAWAALAPLTLLATPVAALADQLGDIPVGHWLEISASRMDTVAPIRPDGERESIVNVMAAWCGALYDTNRDRLIVWGGGHGDYWGNEVYAFDINALEWRRLSEPYWPAKAIRGGHTEHEIRTTNWYGKKADGKTTDYSVGPSSRHTYDNLVYLPPPYDSMFSYGGSLWYSGSGTGATILFSFDADGGTWSAGQTTDRRATVVGGSAWDPVTQLVHFVSEGARHTTYNPATDSWSGAGSKVPEAGTMEIDLAHRQLVLFSRDSNAYIADLEGADAGNFRRLGAVGATEIEHAGSGLAYDQVQEELVAWDGGSAVYSLNLDVDPPVWRKHSPAAGNTATPTDRSKWGTYGRWQYIPSRNLFIGVNRTDENVFILRRSPPVPVMAPGPPVDLRISARGQSTTGAPR